MADVRPLLPLLPCVLVGVVAGLLSVWLLVSTTREAMACRDACERHQWVVTDEGCSCLGGM